MGNEVRTEERGRMMYWARSACPKGLGFRAWWATRFRQGKAEWFQYDGSDARKENQDTRELMGGVEESWGVLISFFCSVKQVPQTLCPTHLVNTHIQLGLRLLLLALILGLLATPKSGSLWGSLLLVPSLLTKRYSVQSNALCFSSWDLVIPKGLPRWPSGKESTCQAADVGSIPRSGISPGERNGNPPQYSCLENPVDRGALWATDDRFTKSQTWLSN